MLFECTYSLICHAYNIEANLYDKFRMKECSGVGELLTKNAGKHKCYIYNKLITLP